MSEPLEVREEPKPIVEITGKHRDVARHSLYGPGSDFDEFINNQADAVEVLDQALEHTNFDHLRETVKAARDRMARRMGIPKYHGE